LADRHGAPQAVDPPTELDVPRASAARAVGPVAWWAVAAWTAGRGAAWVFDGPDRAAAAWLAEEGAWAVIGLGAVLAVGAIGLAAIDRRARSGMAPAVIGGLLVIAAVGLALAARAAADAGGSARRTGRSRRRGANARHGGA
jgi:hypothetical protein